MNKFAHLFVASSVVVSTTAFAPIMQQRRAFVPLRMTSTEESTSGTDAPASDFESAMPDTRSAYARLGVSEEKLAIGVDPNEVLQWLGTRDDLVERFVRDNKAMSRESLEVEVDKFLMDMEMVNACIDFEKRKASGELPSLKEQAEGTLSDPRTWLTYGAWIIGGAAFSYIRKFVIEPKYASGEWKEIHIPLPFQPDDADKSADAVLTTMNSITDSFHNAM